MAATARNANAYAVFILTVETIGAECGASCVIT